MNDAGSLFKFFFFFFFASKTQKKHRPKQVYVEH